MNSGLKLIVCGAVLITLAPEIVLFFGLSAAVEAPLVTAGGLMITAGGKEIVKSMATN